MIDRPTLSPPTPRSSPVKLERYWMGVLEITTLNHRAPQARAHGRRGLPQA